MDIYRIWTYFKQTSLIKTLYLNLKYFPLKSAVKLPIIVSRYSDLYYVGGKIKSNVPVFSGMLMFGFRKIGIVDVKKVRAIWEVRGILILNGKASIGGGTKICVGGDGELILGENFSVSGSSTIICSKHIAFGRDCLLSWDILMMDSDLHVIKDKDSEIINYPAPILIGNHVWIGCRNTILKGVNIASNTVIAAHSTITKSSNDEHVIYGSNNIVFKKDINWEE